MDPKSHSLHEGPGGAEIFLISIGLREKLCIAKE